MMGARSREKGKVFERRIAAVLRVACPRAVVRRSLQAHRAFEPDVVIEGDAPPIFLRLWLELNDQRGARPLVKLSQAEHDAARVGGDRLPIVVWHEKGERRVSATMRVRTLLEVLGVVGAPRCDAVITMCFDELLVELLREVPDAPSVRPELAVSAAG